LEDLSHTKEERAAMIAARLEIFQLDDLYRLANHKLSAEVFGVDLGVLFPLFRQIIGGKDG